MRLNAAVRMINATVCVFGALAGICLADWSQPNFTGAFCNSGSSSSCSLLRDKQCTQNPGLTNCNYCLGTKTITSRFCVFTETTQTCTQPNPKHYVDCGDLDQGTCSADGKKCQDSGILQTAKGCATIYSVDCTGTGGG